MKRILLLCIIFSIDLCYGQTAHDYFSGDDPHCEFQNDEDRNLFKLGLEGLQFKSLIPQAGLVFMSLIKKDSTQCDAYFMVGYTLRLQNKFKEATMFYYLADSLSPKKSLLFKQNLAAAASNIGRFDIAAKAYNDIITYFPDSPEGYYGMANTSIFTGNFENGMIHIDQAFLKYKIHNIKIGNEVYLTKAILLSRTNRQEESLVFFEQVSGQLTKQDLYKLHYAFSLKKVGTIHQDEKMIKKAHKLYDKISDTSMIPEDMALAFKD